MLQKIIDLFFTAVSIALLYLVFALILVVAGQS